MVHTAAAVHGAHAAAVHGAHAVLYTVHMLLYMVHTLLLYMVHTQLLYTAHTLLLYTVHTLLLYTVHTLLLYLQKVKTVSDIANNQTTVRIVQNLLVSQYLSVYEIDMKYEETFLLLFCCSQVNCLFLQKSLASSYLSRIRRANDGLEEVLADNLERECNEETCSVEERQEVLRNNPETEQLSPSQNDTSHVEPSSLPVEGEDASKVLLTSKNTHVTSSADAMINNDTLLVFDGCTVPLLCSLNQPCVFSKNNLSTILTTAGEILKMQTKALEYRQKLLRHNQHLLEQMVDLLETVKRFAVPRIYNS
ncbi:uncharacterized protein [Scyliorhinus torazame]|uniref:uncharacterized protein n=1 Tax=Scyliorhinus torazame TaxID=75743 RepID=UPI003B5C0AFB